jgi:hypothetical protein
MAAPIRAVVVAAVLLATAAAAAHAQGMNLQVVPKIGVFSPLVRFTETTELDTGVALGVAGEVTVPAWPVNLRLNLDHARATDIVRRDATEAVLGTVSISAIVGDVVVRPLPAAARFQPYLLAGAGVKLYSIDRRVELPELTGFGRSATRATLHVGGGVDVRVGPLSLLLEIGNYMSTLASGTGESRMQHDAFGMLGFRVSMF